MLTRSGKPNHTYLKLFSSLIQKIESKFVTFSALLLGGLVIIVMTGVLTRLLGIRVPGVMDFSAFILVSLVFLPLAEVTRSARHVRVEFIDHLIPSNYKKVVVFITSSVALFIVGLIAVLCWQMLFESYESGTVTVGSPHIPLWIPQISIAIGLSIMTIRMIISLFELIGFGKK